ncbi:MAG: FmdB family transcriptional regulator [Actinomycetia bacterium]|nr:FmdB family transcriptional regulator [Actinomycetes bacterium]
MPTYEYRCISCEHQFERFQRMSDEPVKECEVCGEPVKRLLFPVAIQFKGSGFYTTDYARRSTLGHAGSKAANGDGSESSGRSESAETGEAGAHSAGEAGSSVNAGTDAGA